jgi:hypothetical protein
MLYYVPYQVSYICAMTNLQNNEMRNSYIFALQIVVSDRDSAVTSRICTMWNDPQYTTADGKKFAYHGSGEHILYRHKRYPYWVRQLSPKCTSASTIEIWCHAFLLCWCLTPLSMSYIVHLFIHVIYAYDSGLVHSMMHPALCPIKIQHWPKSLNIINIFYIVFYVHTLTTRCWQGACNCGRSIWRTITFNVIITITNDMSKNVHPNGKNGVQLGRTFTPLC